MRHRSLPLLGLALALAACGPINRGLESLYQPVVSRTDYVFDASAAGLADPQGAEARRIAGWFDSLGVGYGDDVAVDGGGAAEAEAVGAVLAERGMLLAPAAPPTEGAVAPGTVRVVVSRSTARVDGCPDWSLPSQPNFENSTMSNFGCATAVNFASSVANPADLVRGQTGYGTDARTVNKAIETYRKYVPTGVSNTVKSEGTGAK